MHGQLGAAAVPCRLNYKVIHFSMKTGLRYSIAVFEQHWLGIIIIIMMMIFFVLDLTSMTIDTRQSAVRSRLPSQLANV